MPGFDGTGPQGKGPMTGRGRGFCVLQEFSDNPGQIKGLAGIQGTPIHTGTTNPSEKREVITMPRGDRTGPAEQGSMTGRAVGFCAGYPVRDYMNPVIGRTGYYRPFAPVIWPYRAGFYGYGIPFGRGFGRGRGRGHRGGRFGRW
ncbi:MAG: DUF5320 domain-containing protein [Sedimentisphaerales bacterium]|nr:DUF5320 domain-containing protein [Sedimentisphaerales bacterium]